MIEMISKQVLHVLTQCLKITEKVASNIASEASYVHILRVKKFIKNAKKMGDLASFWKLEADRQTVLPDMLTLVGQKVVEYCQN